MVIKRGIYKTHLQNVSKFFPAVTEGNQQAGKVKPPVQPGAGREDYDALE